MPILIEFAVMRDVPPDAPTLQALRHALSGFPGIELAIVFGSVAKGCARFDSDLDIAVQSATPLTADNRLALIEAFALASGRAVDLIDLRVAGEPLRGQILRHGLRLEGSDTALASLMMRHVCDNEDFMPYVNRLHRERQQRWMSN